jgi:hypothetical protein
LEIAAMPFDVVHPRDFPSRFGVAKAPTKSTLKRWREQHGFPPSLTVPRGHFRADEVAAWFASRNARPVKSPQAA